VPSATQAMAPGVGRTEEDAAKGSLGVMVLFERLASVPLSPSITGGDVPMGTSRREGSAALGAGGELSLALTLAGSDSPVQGEPLLQWADPRDAASALFPLDNVAESMERETLSCPCSRP